MQKKFVFVPTCHLFGVIGHFRSNCSLLRQKSKPVIRSASRNTNVPKFVPVYHFYGVIGHIRSNCYKSKFKYFVFQFRICDDISSTISPDKSFHMLLKNLSLLTFERKLQDFGVYQKNCVIPQIHSSSHGFSPTKPKTCAIWVRKDFLR